MQDWKMGQKLDENDGHRLVQGLGGKFLSAAKKWLKLFVVQR